MGCEKARQHRVFVFDFLGHWFWTDRPRLRLGVENSKNMSLGCQKPQPKLEANEKTVSRRAGTSFRRIKSV